MSRYSRLILMVGLAMLLLVSTATVASARVTYRTSTPILSRAPVQNKTFTCSGTFSPKSTTKSRAAIKIILWMKYSTGWGVMDTFKANVSGGTRYSRTILMTMKGWHGVQAIQYRNGKRVSKSGIRKFDAKPCACVEP